MTSFPDDDDGAVLKSLVEAGVDLSKPLEIEFHVAVPDEESGNKITEAIKGAGYACELVFDEGEPEDGDADGAGGSHEDPDLDAEEFGPMWTVFVALEMVPEHQRIVDIQVELDGLSKPHGGGADGWGVLV